MQTVEAGACCYGGCSASDNAWKAAYYSLVLELLQSKQWGGVWEEVEGEEERWRPSMTSPLLPRAMM